MSSEKKAGNGKFDDPIPFWKRITLKNPLSHVLRGPACRTGREGRVRGLFIPEISISSFIVVKIHPLGLMIL